MNGPEELDRAIRQRLANELRSVSPSEAGPLRDRVAAVVAEQAAPLSPERRDELVAQILSRTVGLGPLEGLMSDPAVEEIMINGPGTVLVERRGRIEDSGVAFASERQVMNMVERILAPLGRRVDEASPVVDARLADGSRLNCVIPPLSLDGPLVTIRRFRPAGFTPDDLAENGTLPQQALDFLEACVAARCNLLVSGGTGSGKTTLLNALSSLIREGERIITIEDAAELRLRQRHVLRLEARPPSLEGRGEVTIRQLVRNALRMRPDRIIVGEVRGGEALDMLQALNSGHDGSMTTVHANGAADALRRVETLALMADIALPHAAVRRQLASAVDVVVHLERGREGLRRVAEVAEVVRVAGEVGVRGLYAGDGSGAPSGALVAPTDELRRRLERPG